MKQVTWFCQSVMRAVNNVLSHTFPQERLIAISTHKLCRCFCVLSDELLFDRQMESTLTLETLTLHFL